MNIFVTNNCPVQSAREHCRVHNTKMIVELAQMLSTAHRVIDNNQNSVLYKATHVNHPSSIFIRKSSENYKWAYEHFVALCDVYESDRKKVHATAERLREVLKNPPKGIRTGKLTSFPKAMPDKFSGISSDPTVCYQKYLNHKFSEWLSREKPIKVDFAIDTPKWLSNNVRKLLD